MFDEVLTALDREKHIRIDLVSLHSGFPFFVLWLVRDRFLFIRGQQFNDPSKQFVKIFVKKPKSKNDEIVTHFIKEIENKC